MHRAPLSASFRSGLAGAYLSAITWAVDIGLAPADGETEDVCDRNFDGVRRMHQTNAGGSGRVCNGASNCIDRLANQECSERNLVAIR